MAGLCPAPGKERFEHAGGALGRRRDADDADAASARGRRDGDDGISVGVHNLGMSVRGGSAFRPQRLKLLLRTSLSGLTHVFAKPTPLGRRLLRARTGGHLSRGRHLRSARRVRRGRLRRRLRHAGAHLRRVPRLGLRGRRLALHEDAPRGKPTDDAGEDSPLDALRLVLAASASGLAP